MQSRLYEGVIGDADEVRRKMYDNFNSIQPEDIAHLVTTAMNMSLHCDVTLLEVFPTMQSTGGSKTIFKSPVE